MKHKLISYGLSVLSGLALSWLAISAKLSNPDFKLTDASKYMELLCDAAFVPGIVLVCVWCLIFIASTGLFDSVSYSVGYAVRALLPFVRRKEMSFYDYKMGKEERRSEGKTPKTVLIVGAAFLALSLLFLALYYTL